jgi:predicted ATP-grasp superfamily ATP-dependent carboligase
MTASSHRLVDGHDCGGAVLVLGADLRTGLPIVRSLGRRGLKVHVGWCPADSPICWSRYVRKTHSLPPCQGSPDEWRAAIHALLVEHKFDLVIPSSEPEQLALQRHGRQLGIGTQIYLLNERAFAVSFDKTKIFELASSLGIPQPASVVVSNVRAAGASFGDATGPLFVKPTSSLSGEDLTNKQSVLRFDDVAEARRFLCAHEKSAPFLVQEKWPGVGVGVEFLARQGEILPAFQHRRLHETSGHGSTYRMGEALDPMLVDATQRLLKALEYTGVGMCEFRVDETAQRWALLELNARFWGSLPLAVAAGADFPWYLYQMLVHEERVFPNTYKIGVRCRTLRPDLAWTWRSLTRSRTQANSLSAQRQGRGINEVPRKQVVRHLIRLVACRDHLDSFSWDDPKPLVGGTWRACKKAIRRLRRALPNSSQQET